MVFLPEMHYRLSTLTSLSAIHFCRDCSTYEQLNALLPPMELSFPDASGSGSVTYQIPSWVYLQGIVLQISHLRGDIGATPQIK